MTALHQSSIQYNGEPVKNNFHVTPELRHPTIKVRSEKVKSRPFPYTWFETRWRKRPHDEIKYLRGYVVELEHVKNALSNPCTKSNLREESRMGTTDRGHNDCCNQMLDAALAENRKLRAMVAGRYQVAKTLRDTIDEHARRKARKGCWPTSAAAGNDLMFALLDEATEL
ncbi:unnamed protein product [Peronospora belbahrii]|uniref:Uncharacterized protein n=1 Tax=Peronospora belbahrii TaxID=622444 RepID=A0ABN8D9Q9_9STRA|nr:unnamed protein product [Peronospora belbahrii]